jgi:hypothetical protein
MLRSVICVLLLWAHVPAGLDTSRPGIPEVAYEDVPAAMIARIFSLRHEAIGGNARARTTLVRWKHLRHVWW